jgi:hypothetical protein
MILASRRLTLEGSGGDTCPVESHVPNSIDKGLLTLSIQPRVLPRHARELLRQDRHHEPARRMAGGAARCMQQVQGCYSTVPAC